jgi:ATP-binding cassette subfamily B protein
MASAPDKQNDSTASLPKDLIEHLSERLDTADILSAAPYDLDDHGNYIEAYLVLTADRYGTFRRESRGWREDWFPFAGLTSSIIVEGLGMNLLRLSSDDRAMAEFRFTLRHARMIGAFQRRLERIIQGHDIKDIASTTTPPHIEDKRVRCEKCDRLIPAWAEMCPACMSRRKILYRLFDFLLPYKWQAIAALFFSLLLTGMGMLSPWLTRPLVDYGLGAAKGFEPDYDQVFFFTGMIALLLLLSAVGMAFQLRLSMGLGALVCCNVRNAVYRHLHKLSLAFFTKRQTGSLVTRVTTDTQRLSEFVSSMLISMVLSVLTLIGVGVGLFATNWRLAIVVLLPVPLTVMLVVFFHEQMHRIFRRIWHRWSQMTAVVADALPGVRVIKAFSQEDREITRFEKQSNEVLHEERRFINKTRALFGPMMMFTGALGSLLVWFYGGWLVCRTAELGGAVPIDERVYVGTLVAFQAFLAMFMRPIHQIAHMDEQFNRAATSAHRIFEILDTQPAIYSKHGADRAENLRGRIELRNVSFSYDGVHKVLKNINLTIEAGEMLGLAGPSGGGKTTLINLISRFYDVLDGEILIDGVDVRDYSIRDLRRKIGVVLQEPFLFHGTIAENIAYAKPEATLEEIITAARAANANDFILGFSDGYDTMVGERGQTLSGGERQRISIARAILNNPPVLILDEATSSVDTETEKLIQQALDQLTADRTTIAIAHRLSTLRKADRLAILEKGVLIEEGTHEQLANKEGGLYAKLLRLQRDLQSTMALVD